MEKYVTKLGRKIFSCTLVYCQGKQCYQECWQNSVNLLAEDNSSRILRRVILLTKYRICNMKAGALFKELKC
jgi:hypothetical protein